MKLVSAALLLSVSALCACGGSNSSSSTNQQFNDYRTQGPVSPADSITSGSKSSAATNTGVAVNAYLWRGSLDTLSFMPLVSADPFGGVIITDWYSPPGISGERFKATIYILGRELRADDLRVSIFRQNNTGGVWQDSTVADSTATDIEDKILARARELRSGANGAG